MLVTRTATQGSRVLPAGGLLPSAGLIWVAALQQLIQLCLLSFFFSVCDLYFLIKTAFKKGILGQWVIISGRGCWFKEKILKGKYKVKSFLDSTHVAIVKCMQKEDNKDAEAQAQPPQTLTIGLGGPGTPKATAPPGDSKPSWHGEALAPEANLISKDPTGK